ncbi:MAG TPA: transcription elongation factor GreA [Candidatus Paceibacterota bacterium]|uniref:Transcription elongation factor GreA n=3 Tax=Bacteria candidate phyla TaxID=1783234 RepID=A0A0G1WJH3_9BACT|nr:MAG: Transcription elongation factor GreA [Candidatus Adlerbacteria bacterium GW2011_GWC1_50_9]KKW29356.1 MAG: Transcription elongation factor GreA [Candidatus Kaiserbacteria bacterium GW2011_GWC2_52_8b]OGE74587.1 MAG: transcription elongation factor GreA [Candidatus Doudnabacteria bacterium RIFCSPHIGHO2_01_52_17]
MENQESQNPDAEYLSQEGFSRLKKELTELKNVRRKEIAARLEYAKSLGDLSENAEYTEAKDEQLEIEGRISDLEDILSRAVLISHTASSSVNLGATVQTRREDKAELETYTIVGPQEADPPARRISNESPLGRALLGRTKGELVTVYTPKGEMRYHIIDIA